MVIMKRFRLFHQTLRVLTVSIGLAVWNIGGVSGQTIPRPDHVVICVLENHAYWSVAGSPHAPYLNDLMSRSAVLQEYYALTHPSQPNYLMLYSGDNQGVTDDNLPASTPWSTPNLGASLLQSGFTFTGYSEDLPAAGSLVEVSAGYYRKHAPWVNWQGNGTHQLPVACNQPFSAFPVDYNFLPDVSFVIPNIDHDMHDGTEPTRIEVGNGWVRDHLQSYIDWADQNNSLFILVFDEDDDLHSNHILCFFHGPMVRPGTYAQHGYHHYDLLRTLEEMFALPLAGASSVAEPIAEIWQTATAVGAISASNAAFVAGPNPVVGDQSFLIESSSEFNDDDRLVLYDATGRLLFRQHVGGRTRQVRISPGQLPETPGLYIWQVESSGSVKATGRMLRQ